MNICHVLILLSHVYGGRDASLKSKLNSFLKRFLKQNGFGFLWPKFFIKIKIDFVFKSTSKTKWSRFFGRDASLKSKSTSFLNRLLKRNYFVFWPRFFIKININFVCKMVFKTKWFRFLWPRCFIQKHFVSKTIFFLKPFSF